jgi:hypothetical protein
MKTLLTCGTAAALALAVASPARPAEERNPAPDAAIPRTVTNAKADRAEILALLRALEDAVRRSDVNGAASLVDFPVLMVTDDAKGEAMADTWSKDQWIEVMAPFYRPAPGTTISHRPAIFLVTDSLATVADEVTVTTGKQKFTTRSALVVVRTGGKWKVKSMVEGGWGGAVRDRPEASDAPPAARPSGGAAPSAPSPTPPAAPGAGAPEPAKPPRDGATPAAEPGR